MFNKLLCPAVKVVLPEIVIAGRIEFVIVITRLLLVAVAGLEQAALLVIRTETISPLIREDEVY